MKTLWKRIPNWFWHYLITTLALLALWQMTSMIVYALFWGTEDQHDYRYFTYLLPSPMNALLSFMEDWQLISRGFGASAVRIIVSVLLAILIGTPIGLVMGYEKRIGQFLSPLLYITNPIPKVVFTPLLFAFLGLGNSPKIVLITLLLVFPVMLAARDAAKNIPKTYILSVRSLNATPAQIYRHVILPACLPSILSTARVSIGFATVGLAITEAWAVSSRSVGLWTYVMNAHYAFHYTDIFAGILAFALLGILVYALIDLLERFICRWNYVA